MGQEVHHGQQGVEVLFGFDDPDGEEEGTGGGGEGSLEGTLGEVGHAIVDDMAGFTAQVDVAGSVLLSEAGDEAEVGGGVDLALEPADVALALGSLFFIDEVHIVDGQQASCCRGGGAERRELVDGVPAVEPRHEARQKAIDVFCLEIGDIMPEGTEEVLGHEQGDLAPWGDGFGVEGIPAAVAEGYLSQAAEGVAKDAEVDENLHALPSSCSVSSRRRAYLIKV